jgi:hypothetical protein
MTADPHMDGCTVGFDRPRLHHSREGINPIYLDMLAHLRTPGLFLGGRRRARHRFDAFYNDRNKMCNSFL